MMRIIYYALALISGWGTFTVKGHPQERVTEDITEIRNEDTTRLSASGVAFNYEYVDLGLSVKWAMYNIGSNTYEGYGEYFAWGDTICKRRTSPDSCDTFLKKMYGNISGSNSDVARKRWGGKWRLPTQKEFQELIDKCKIEWTSYGGIKGVMVTSKVNGNRIFLPAAGHLNYSNMPNDTGTAGLYWTGSPEYIYDSQETNEEIKMLMEIKNSRAYGFYFSEKAFRESLNDRCYGLNIRPVISLP